LSDGDSLGCARPSTVGEHDHTPGRPQRQRGRDLTAQLGGNGIGGGCFYSLIDRYEIAEREDLLPIGLAKGARVIRPVKKDSPISCSDVQLKEPSVILDLRRVQNKWTRGQITEAELLAAVDSFAVD